MNLKENLWLEIQKQTIYIAETQITFSCEKLTKNKIGDQTHTPQIHCKYETDASMTIKLMGSIFTERAKLDR